MKKRTPVFLAIIFIAFPTEAYGLTKGLSVLSFSVACDFPSQIFDDADIPQDSLLGIGLNFPLHTKISDKFKIEPLISAEYNFSMFGSGLLRIRTGAHFGKLSPAFFVGFWGGYYAGLSGVFIKDFANDMIAFGISPEIGFECYILFLGMRVQAQYDFYTTERYNRFVLTTSLCIIFPLPSGFIGDYW